MVRLTHPLNTSLLTYVRRCVRSAQPTTRLSVGQTSPPERRAPRVNLQPYVVQPVALADPACNPARSSLQPYVLQVLAELEALKLDSSTLVVSTALEPTSPACRRRSRVLLLSEVGLGLGIPLSKVAEAQHNGSRGPAPR